MVLPVTQRAFTERHAEWLRADAEASAAERDIAAALERCLDIRALTEIAGLSPDQG